jgi:hypothetical protein
LTEAPTIDSSSENGKVGESLTEAPIIDSSSENDARNYSTSENVANLDSVTENENEDNT